MFKLIQLSFSFELILMIRTIIDIHLRVGSHTQVNADSRNHRNTMGLLLERFIVDSESSDCIEIDGDRSHLYIT